MRQTVQITFKYFVGIEDNFAKYGLGVSQDFREVTSWLVT